MKRKSLILPGSFIGAPSLVRTESDERVGGKELCKKNR